MKRYGGDSKYSNGHLALELFNRCHENDVLHQYIYIFVC